MLKPVSLLLGMTLCAGSTLGTAQAAPKSKPMNKEQNVPASRLHVGDVVYAIHGATETVFDGNATARVASLSPLTLNLIRKKVYPKSEAYPKGKNASPGDDFDSGVLMLTGTGNRSGTIAFITVVKPNGVIFTRLR